METWHAANILSALAHDTRLAIYGLLAQQGSEGLAAGNIGEALGLAPATLSFHLRELARAGLIRSRQQSRFIYYRADLATMKQVLAYLANACREPLAAPQASEPAAPRVVSSIAKPVVRPKPRPI
jgi:ArsR family transcriptional regulator, arsenate/arsenite/antimonite-responsive transcriptional repressor